MFTINISKDDKQGSLTVECDSQDQALAFVLEVMDPFQNPINETRK